MFGIPSALNLNLLSNQDFVWGLGLILSGAFISFTLVKAGISRIRTEVILVDKNDLSIGHLWEKIISYVVPAMAAALLLWWLSLCATVYAPKEWWNPLSPFSVATVLGQWALVLLIFRGFNRWISEKMVK